mmetsp:Transcript_24376/g.83338  ORF Transcript_24376/g.83338 Transcript_24376/m.83338 type:complete len:196 (+) Transcript_24376:518-1105(+)
MKGLAISNSDSIRKAHNSFARPDPVVDEPTKTSASGDIFHFISYMPFNGALYELDGLRPCPVRVATLTNGEDWPSLVCSYIRNKFLEHPDEEIRFNLMALVRDRKEVYEEKVAQLMDTRLHVLSASTIADTQVLQAEGTKYNDSVTKIDAELFELRAKLENEEERRHLRAIENTQRRHNYMPFIYHLLKLMVEKH